MNWSELDMVVLDRWANFDAAANLQHRVNLTVVEALAEGVARWCRARGWVGVFGPNGIWFAPPAWSLSGGKRSAADAWYQWEYGYGDDDDADAGDDHWDLTRLLGIGRGISGFRLKQTRRPNKEWSSIILENAQHPSLLAFTLDDAPSLFLTFTLNKDEVVKALQDEDFTEALLPVTRALDTLEGVLPLIDPWLGPRKT